MCIKYSETKMDILMKDSLNSHGCTALCMNVGWISLIGKFDENLIEKIDEFVRK